MLVGIGIGSCGLFRWFRRVRIPQKELKTVGVDMLTEQLLRQNRAVLSGAGADEFRHAHGLQLLRQRLDAGFFVAVLR